MPRNLPEESATAMSQAPGHTPEMVAHWVKLGHWGREVLGDYLDHSAATYPEKIALIFDGKRISYAVFGRLVNRLALALVERGIKPRDCVLLMLPNYPEYAYMHFALAKIGAICVPMVPTYGQADLEYVIEFCDAKALVITAQYGNHDYLSMVKEILPKCPQLKHIFITGDGAPEGMIAVDTLLEEPLEERYPAGRLASLKPAGTDTLRLHLTAGTTGAPKAIVVPHNAAVCTIKCNAVGHEWGERLLNYFPIAHATGHLVGLELQVMLGRTMMMTTKPFDAHEMLRLIEAESVTRAYMPLPYLFELKRALESDDELLQKYSIDSLNAISFGGVPPQRETVEYLRVKLGRPILQTYGMGEGIVTSASIDDPPETQTYAVGRMLCDDGEIKAIDENNEEVPLGEVGELAYRGPFTFAGYLKNPEATRQTLDNERFVHSGDMVRLDEAGNIWIVGRKKDIIRRGGESIPVAEVEAIIWQHPSVAEIAIVAMPDPRMGEKACAYVRPKDGQSFVFDDMIGFLKTQKIAKFKWPERLELVDDFQRDTRKGAILKRALRDDIAQKLEKERKS